MTPGIGIAALSVAFPSVVRRNDHFVSHTPELVEQAHARTLARVFSNDGTPQSIFDRAMARHESDPFRGAVERRVLARDEDGLGLELAAAREALASVHCAPADIDTLISVGFLSRDIGIGNAVHLAKALGLRGNAWNLESACGGPLQAMQVARALIASEQARRVLVTTSCTYSARADPRDSLGWFLGDGAGAFLVGRVEPSSGIVGAYARHTADTCGTWYHALEADDAGARIVMRASAATGRVMRASAQPHLVECCHGALADAGLALDDIDCFVPHTPTAWFADFAAQALGFPRERTIDTYPAYANVGPALTPANLHRAVASGRLRPGDTALVFGPGSASSAAAVVLRWSDAPVTAHGCALPGDAPLPS